MTLEVGYIGRRITHEYQPVELNPVPYMMTLGGQSLSKPTRTWCCNTAAASRARWRRLRRGKRRSDRSVTAQPFFEPALKGTGYCTV